MIEHFVEFFFVFFILGNEYIVQWSDILLHDNPEVHNISEEGHPVDMAFEMLIM
ncbi:hypothetical protein P5673_028988 [Acropora cervicornis]|uniref:Uncharacterized protein n=1 Tax=Acropora cervicornis TaxID=6130 RepID=A0AAD9PWE0_ACRCE|nr:hypothetical protein P5673_028988 [Acropora cervicornis]